MFPLGLESADFRLFERVSFGVKGDQIGVGPGLIVFRQIDSKGTSDCNQGDVFTSGRCFSTRQAHLSKEGPYSTSNKTPGFNLNGEKRGFPGIGRVRVDCITEIKVSGLFADLSCLNSFF